MNRLTDKRWFWPIMGLIALGLCYLLRDILPPFLFALFFAYLCQPIVDFLERRQVSRTISSCLVVVTLSLLLVGFLLIFFPMLQSELLQFLQKVPDYLAVLDNRIGPVLSDITGHPIRFDIASLQKIIGQNLESLSDLGIKFLRYITQRSGAFISITISLLMTPLIFFYALRDWKKIIHLADQAIPRRIHDQVTTIVSEMDDLLSKTLRGLLLVVVIQSFLYGLALWTAGLNFAFTIGMITGILSLIPYIGFTFGFLLGMITAALQFDTLLPIIGVLLAFGVVQFFESFFLTPNIVGDRIGLHPVGVIFALLAFGELFGFIGVLIALPATSLVVVGMRHIGRAYKNSRYYLGETTPPPPPQD